MVTNTLNLLELAFARPALLWLLALVSLAMVGSALVRRRRRRAMQKWLGEQRPAVASRREWLAGSCRSLALMLIVVGSAGPQWGRDPEAPPSLGRDILIVLDVSRSMLAEGPPTRLDRAKQYVRELSEVLQRQGDYRLGLVAFAGQAKVMCPLTEDYEHFRFALELAHPNRFGAAGRLGHDDDGTSYGTSLRSALSTAAMVADSRYRGFQHLILVSDGDDLAGGWASGVLRVRQAGLAMHILGVGNPASAMPIPSGRLEEPYILVEDDNGVRQRALTRRNDELLGAMALAAGGTYHPEESGARPLVQWYEDNVAFLPAREWTEDHQALLVQRYGWFFGAALVLWAAGMALANRPLPLEDRP